MRDLKLSRFAYFLPLDEVTALYHSLNLSILFLAKTAAENLKELSLLQQVQQEEVTFLPDEIVHQLTQRRFLVPVQENEEKELTALQESLLRQGIGICYLLLTDRCNFACDYCMIEGGIPEGHCFSMMTPGVARKGLSIFANSVRKSGAKEPHVLIYGGEPLLNRETLIFALCHVEKLRKAGTLPDTTKVSINTNGSLVDLEIAKLLAKHGVEVSVSLDGRKEQHDQKRKYGNGRGTFEDVIKGIRILQEAGASVSVSCTIDTHNIGELPKIILWMKEELGIRGVGFNTLLDSDRMQVSNDQYIVAATKGVINSFLVGRARGIYEDRIMRKAKAFVEGRAYLRDCGGYGQQIVILPEGQIGVCHAYCGSRKYFVEEPDDDFDPTKHPYWQEWAKRSPIFMPQCQNCVAIGICGGGCAHNAELKTGSIWGLDESFCLHTKLILDFLIRDLAEKTLSSQADGLPPPAFS